MCHEQETFFDLLTSFPHWCLEIVIMIVFDVIIGIIVWPRFKRRALHHKSDDDKLAELERRIKIIEQRQIK